MGGGGVRGILRGRAEGGAGDLFPQPFRGKSNELNRMKNTGSPQGGGCL